MRTHPRSPTYLLCRTRLLAVLLLLLFVQVAQAAREGIASAHPLATAAGEAVLAAGGNAFDAAVTVAAALAVVEPYASGLGGGGFFLLHRASDGHEVFVDARETAPGAASADMYLDAAGVPQPRASLDGGKAAAIPGLPAALAHLAGRYGTRPLAELLAPAVRLAESGFEVDGRYVAAAGWRRTALAADAETARIFLDAGEVPKRGFVVRQPGLAATLRSLAEHGEAGFYHGPVAEELVRGVRAAGGVWTLEDLAGYRVVEREPFRLEYRGARITSAPLPSSGGLVLAQALQILACFDLDRTAGAERAHLVVEALRRAYQDRARHMGDGDFVAVPVERLSSADYARSRAASIDPARATPSAELEAAQAAPEGDNTTHFSIVDAQGNRIAATLSINAPFGAAAMAGGTGVLLNNEMNDFAIATGVGNLYGLTGRSANLVAPGKRPLSSMSPTFAEDERGVLVLGTPGGSRIISMVLLALLEHLHAREVDLYGIVGAPRYHHQFLPDRVQTEPGAFPDEWKRALEAKGHVVEDAGRRWGNMQAVFRNRTTGEVTAVGDPRGKTGVLF
jgi:gamma-glutamyltranspeptidase/glutathione hydrolase